MSPSLLVDFLDLKALYESLEAGAELADRADSILLLYRAARNMQFVEKDIVLQNLLIAPEFAEFHILQDDSIGFVFFRKLAHNFRPLLDLVSGHEAGAEAGFQVMAADRFKGSLSVANLYLFPTRLGAKAVAVGYNHRAA